MVVVLFSAPISVSICNRRSSRAVGFFWILMGFDSWDLTRFNCTSWHFGREGQGVIKKEKLILLASGLVDLSSHSMSLNPMDRIALTGLNPETYEHPSDRKALKSLEKMPGISTLFKKVNEYGIDRLLRLQCVGSDIRVTARNFPDLYAAFLEACRILCVEPIPELYLIRGAGHIQTFTYGVEQSIVMINIEGMEQLTSDEWIYLFGHEIAHIKSRHMLYYQSAIVLPTLKHILATTTLGLGGLATSGFELGLFNWLMMAKFTADRAGLLACQNLETAISTLVKVAGLPTQYVTPIVIEDFKQQALEFEYQSDNKLDKITQTLSFMEHLYPWSVLRASELLQWVDSGGYDAFFERPPEPMPDQPPHWNFLSSW